MEPFLRDFFPDVAGASSGTCRVSNYCKFDSQLLTLFTSSLYISGLLTVVLLASWIKASRGRSASMLLGSFAYIAGAVNVSMAILGRALLGVGVSFTTQSVPLYMDEMAPA
uniref:Major facilitator superfamily (MFS) profile domain-containing protein n=1 Tax=Oryza meridionalis TaxID=40149 RepID=A0A0E0F664_9ORYZ